MEKKESKKVLVIDDDQSMRECAAYFLIGDGYKVTVCASGDEGVEFFKNEPFDLVIVDIIMPGRDGLATISEMQNHDPKVKTLAISGADLSEDLLQAAQLFGAVYTLRKPFTCEQLLKCVHDIFSIAEEPL